MFLLRKPRVWLAFFVVLSMCGDHESRDGVLVMCNGNALQFSK